MTPNDALKRIFSLMLDRLEVEVDRADLDALVVILDANPALNTSTNQFKNRLGVLVEANTPVPDPTITTWHVEEQYENSWSTIAVRDSYTSAFRWLRANPQDGARIVGVVS